MEKKKILSIFSIVYAIIIIIIFTSFLLIVTSKGLDKTSILIRRSLISMFFIILGGAFVKFKGKLAEFFYVRKDIAKFKNEEGKQKAIYQAKYIGTCMFIVGVLLLLLALIWVFI